MRCDKSLFGLHRGFHEQNGSINLSTTGKVPGLDLRSAGIRTQYGKGALTSLRNSAQSHSCPSKVFLHFAFVKMLDLLI